MFLNVDPITEEEPPIPVDYNGENDYTIIRRDRWYARILRRAFDTYIETVCKEKSDTTFKDRFEEKITLEAAIEGLTDNWEGARAKLEDLQALAGTGSGSVIILTLCVRNSSSKVKGDANGELTRKGQKNVLNT